MADTPSLESKVVEVITDLTANITQAKDFVLGEIPSIFKEYLTYYTYKYLFIEGVLLVLILLSIYSLWKWIPNDSKWDKDEQGNREFMWVLLVGILIVSIIYLLSNSLYLIQILVAPKLWLLENISSLIKTLR